MTRRPPLDPQAVAEDQLSSKVSRGGGSERPQFRPGSVWLLLAAGLLFFFGHAASVGRQLPKGLRQDAPLVTSRLHHCTQQRYAWLGRRRDSETPMPGQESKCPLHSGGSAVLAACSCVERRASVQQRARL
jgi:hypothetical protein